MARPPAPAPTRRPSAPRPPAGGARRAPAPPQPPRRKALWTVVRALLIVGLLVVIALGALIGVAYARTPIPSPKDNALKATTTVLYKDGSVMGTLPSDINRIPLTPEEMPKVVKEAAVASEDRSFYTNKGVSVMGLARAVWGVVTRSDRGGGSTITQQYVKNITEQDQHTYSRKFTEALEAVKLDQQQSKDQILTSYLNTIYFGRNTNGVAAAAQAYFGLADPSQMTIQQAALLIGIIPAPSAWDPATDPKDAQLRYSYVLAGLVKTGYLTQSQADASATMPATIAPATSMAKFTGVNGYILQAVESEVNADLANASVKQTLGFTDGATPPANTAGLTVTTTIDATLQKDATDTMNNPRVYPTSGRPTTLQAGLISLDPTSGGVVAMYGGPDAQTKPYNTVTQGQAQAGSTFKPFTLLAALQDGIPLSQTFNGSSPQYFPWYTDNGKEKPVSNFGPGRGEQFGSINLVTATAQSVNTVFVQLNHRVGADKTAAMAKALHVRGTIDANPANVLGTATVYPQDMAAAYATLAAQGVYHAPHFVASMKRAGQGGTYTTPTTGERVLDSKVVADAVYAMQQVVKSGTAASAGRALHGRPAAGKTGTVQANHAAWFNAFTPQLETAVVLYNTGLDGKSQASIPGFGGVREVTGGTIPATIWSAYMTKALAGQPIETFPAPSRAVTAAPTSAPTSTATPTSTPTSGATSSQTAAPTSSSDDSSDQSGQGGQGDQNGQGGQGGQNGQDGQGQATQGTQNGQAGQNGTDTNAAGADIGQAVTRRVASQLQNALAPGQGAPGPG